MTNCRRIFHLPAQRPDGLFNRQSGHSEKCFAVRHTGSCDCGHLHMGIRGLPVPSAAPCRSLGAHKVLLASVALVTPGVFIFANATSYPMLLAPQLVMALGA
ncbi:hypothetical protein D3C77_284260 [compost metagenome]